MLGAVAWLLFILAGWVVLMYVAFAVPGSWTAAWAWIRGLPLLVQLGMWLLLLPWMIALWIWNTSWALWLRALLVIGIAWVTFVLSVPPVFDAFRGK